MTLTELADATGMYKSTVLRLATSLERFNFLTRLDNNKYVIGREARRVGLLHAIGLDLEPLLRDELKWLVAETNETAAFYVKEDDKRVCLFLENSPRPARHHLEEGIALPLHSGASGHVLRAWHNPLDASNRPVLDQGYAISLGERDPDLAAISVPLLDQHETMHGALVVSGIITRFTAENIELMLETLRSSASRLKKRLPSSDPY